MSKIVPMINNTPGACVSIPKSSQYLKRSIEQLFEPKFYAKCPTCKEINVCPGNCNSCGEFIEKKRNDYFVYFPIEPQIKKHLIENFEEICAYMNRQRNEMLPDIDDGEVEKNVHKEYLPQEVLTFTLNIDGGVITEKTSKSLWPIQLYLNFLPPMKRFLPKNIIVAGLYYDEHKPNTFELLFPMLNDFRRLFEEGIQLVYWSASRLFAPTTTCLL